MRPRSERTGEGFGSGGRAGTLAVLRHPTYARLFAAQVIALLGTGLLTVALGLLAFDVAGSEAGFVLGVAMTIKMIAYVAVAPAASALLAGLPRRNVLIGADVVRAVVALALPFVSETWQIYALIFVLQAASATFTPTFQAVIPAVLPDERAYTRALSLVRLAYDLESLVSPLIAAALLSVVGYHHLFIGTVIGFAVSALLVMATRLPAEIPAPPAGFVDRFTRGLREFHGSRELRGLMGLSLAVAAASALVVINTVVIVRADLGRPGQDVAFLLGAYGAGSMCVALAVPRLLERCSERVVMLAGGGVLPVLLPVVGLALWGRSWVGLLLVWAAMGAAVSLVLTPSARLLRRASTAETRPAVFAAQFSLSHACFLLTYPVAGMLGAAAGLGAALTVLTVIALVGALAAAVVWRAPARTDHTRAISRSPVRRASTSASSV